MSEEKEAKTIHEENIVKLLEATSTGKSEPCSRNCFLSNFPSRNHKSMLILPCLFCRVNRYNYDHKVPGTNSLIPARFIKSEDVTVSA